MSKRAEEAALKALPYNPPETYADMDEYIEVESGRIVIRAFYQKAYEQAEKDMIERACQLLYDYNKQMTEMFGEKAVLSCSQFTIDVERFRKTLIIEEE